VDGELCEALREYNFYLQVGLLSGEALSAIYKSQLKALKLKAAEKYAEKRAKLAAKYGENSKEVKALDEHFGIVKGAGNWLDDIYNAQKSIINQWKNNIATATNIRKGNFGEIASDAFLAEKNFQPLHTRLQSIDAPTRQGIDGVFKKGNEYFIVESKYHGTTTLGNTIDGKQMSDAWINGSDRLLNAVGPTILQDINAVGYRRLLAEVSPDGSIIYKELDASANVIGTFTP
jgi:hypothetical protein